MKKYNQYVESLYSQINEQNDDNYFSPNVDVDLIYPHQNHDVDHDQTTGVKFDINIQHSSVGIKGFDVSILGIVPVHAQITSWDDEDKTERIVIDPRESEITTQYSNGKSPVDDYGQIIPYSVEITVNEDWKPIKTIVTF